MPLPQYQLPQIKEILDYFSIPSKHILIIVGPRQIGKTTLVQQALQAVSHSIFLSVDCPENPLLDFDNQSDPSDVFEVPHEIKNEKWLIAEWKKARERFLKNKSYVLAIDEIQKIPRWSSTIKGLWDEDIKNGTPMHVVLLGSSQLLIRKGMADESLVGRYECLTMTYWFYKEMSEAFDISLDEYLYFGGYPGAHQFINEEQRWRNYISDSVIRPIIDKDINEIARIDKPALFQQVFEFGCCCSGQAISLNKFQSEIAMKGHIVTLSNYLEILSKAHLLTGLQRYSNRSLKRLSPLKFNVNNTAFMTAINNYSFEEAKQDRSYWGHLSESGIGSYLINYKNRKSHDFSIYYWQNNHNELDFVLLKNKKMLAIEVKSGQKTHTTKGLNAFLVDFPKSLSLVIGKDMSFEDFLTKPLENLF